MIKIINTLSLFFKMGNSSGISTEWLFAHCFQMELGFGKCWFLVEGGKRENLDKDPLSKGRGPTID